VTDAEKRDLVLRRLYELRNDGPQYLTAKNPPLVADLSLHETLRICAQLHKDGLLQARTLHRSSETRAQEYDFGIVEITSPGVGLIEDNPFHKAKQMQTTHINFNNSSNNVVGNHNKVAITQHIVELERMVDQSNGTPEQKAEAKGLLKRFAEHPLVAAVVSGGIGLLGG
jgi:hypothetical protein